MGTSAAIAAVCSIVLSFLTTGQMTYNTGIQHLNGAVRRAINGVIDAINSQLTTNRMKVSKLIALLQSKSTNQLMTYLQTNPVVSKKLSDIQGSSDLIASLQAAQNTLENEISAMINQIQSYGYGQSISQIKSEDEAAADIYERLKTKQKEYEDLSKDLEDQVNQNVSTTIDASTYTKDLDARSQNIKGGLVK